MRFSRLFLAFSIICLGIQMPIQAVNLGLKSKTIIGLFAGAGSLLATGAAHVVESFKKDSLADAQTRVAQLENQITGYQLKELCDMNFNDGLLIGAITVVLVSAVILAIANSSAPESKNDSNDKAELSTIKA